MITSIKVSSPEGMAGFLSQIDPFQGAVDGYPRLSVVPDPRENDSCHVTLAMAGYIVTHLPRNTRDFYPDPEVKAGIDYIVQCELG